MGTQTKEKTMVQTCVVLTALVCLALAAGTASASTDIPLTNGTVYYSSSTNLYSYVAGRVDPSGAAFGSFSDGEMINGWGRLTIVTNSTYADEVQMYAAGWLEAELTAPRIWEQYNNIYNFFWPNGTSPSAKVLEWFDTQATFVTSMVANNPKDDLWQQIGMIMAQFDGLVEGYAAVAPASQQIGTFGFQMLNGAGDLLDLMNAVGESERPNFEAMTGEEIKMYFYEHTHCSGLIKIAPDYSEIWASHSSWFVFAAMNRIQKQYNFNVNAPFVASKKMTFSSYPGFLESLDDFYIMDSGLVMVQTTNSIFNMSIYEHVHTSSLLAWQRVRAANSMASTGKEWWQVVASYNSGTYNNQYMVLDTKLFTPGKMLPNNTLWIVEQIPGLVYGEDMTEILETGYWPSYNIPAFPIIWERSGYGTILNQTGDQGYTWDLAPRAQIFRRDQTNVDSLDTLKTMMRYNDYKTDPLAHGSPMEAICSRGDLLPGSQASPFGCYDTKVTNVTAMVPTLAMEAVNGPTTSGVPPFSWSENPTFNATVHMGMPNTFDFDFVSFVPDWTFGLKELRDVEW